MSQLKKSIGKKTLLFLTINALMGTGIFFLPAIAAAYSGAASILAWIIMSFVAIIISFYFAELVSLFPKAGGVYEYAKQTYGEFPSFLIGWIAWMLASFTIAIEIAGSAMYLLPGSVLVIPVSLLFILLFNYITYRGISHSSRLLVFFGIATLFSLLIIVMPGIPAVSMENLAVISFSLPMLLLSMYFISDTFAGWESTTYLAEEVKDAKRVMPRILVTSTLIVVLLSIAVAVVSIGVIGQGLAAENAPLSAVASNLFGTEFGKIFAILVFIPMIGTAFSWVVASPRLLYAMSRDKVLVHRLSKIHKKYKTPHYAVLFQAVVASFVTLVAYGSYHTMLSMMIPLEIIVYSAVLLIILKLRTKQIKTGFRSPFGRLGALFVLAFNAMLMFIWLQQVRDAALLLMMSLFLVSFGIPFYFIIKLQTDKKFIEKFYDRISWLWDKTFPIWYGSKEIDKVIKRIKIRKGMTVLDFGCGSGITTLELAKRIGEDGKIVAVDLSEKQLNKAFSKIEKASEASRVIFIKERHLRFPKNSFDAIVGVGVLEHLDNPQKHLRKLFTMLKHGGRFSFLSFGKSLGVPAPEFLKKKRELIKMFRRLGVHAKARREKKRGTEYIYIWGKKS